MTWLPFQLHPEYPPEGIPRAQLLARVGNQDGMRARFTAEGLQFNPNPDVIPQTMTALRLTELAREHGRHAAIHDRLMDAYWNDGADLGDIEVLRGLAHDLPAEDVERVLTTDLYADRIAASTSEAQSIGINGIPAWVIDGRLLVPGAQPREVFEQAFAQLAER